jgi:HAMP domain-containing protein
MEQKHLLELGLIVTVANAAIQPSAVSAAVVVVAGLLLALSMWLERKEDARMVRLESQVKEIQDKLSAMALSRGR